jgi:hypothetical protein
MALAQARQPGGRGSVSGSGSTSTSGSGSGSGRQQQSSRGGGGGGRGDDGARAMEAAALALSAAAQRTPLTEERVWLSFCILNRAHLCPVDRGCIFLGARRFFTPLREILRFQLNFVSLRLHSNHPYTHPDPSPHHTLLSSSGTGADACRALRAAVARLSHGRVGRRAHIGVRRVAARGGRVQSSTRRAAALVSPPRVRPGVRGRRGGTRGDRARIVDLGIVFVVVIVILEWRCAQRRQSRRCDCADRVCDRAGVGRGARGAQTVGRVDVVW